MKKKKYQKTRKIISSIIVISIVTFFVGFFIYTNWKIGKRRAELSATISRLQKEVIVMEERNSNLIERKEKTESIEYAEEVAREQLELKKPGEEVFVVQKEPAEDNTTIPEEQKPSWWDNIKSIWQK